MEIRSGERVLGCSIAIALITAAILAIKYLPSNLRSGLDQYLPGYQDIDPNLKYKQYLPTIKR